MDKIFRIRIDSDDFEQLTNFLNENQLDIGCTGGIRKIDGRFSVEAYGSEKETMTLRENVLRKMISDKISLDLIDITQYLSDRQKEVGKGDRYKDTKAILRGYGTKVKQ